MSTSPSNRVGFGFDTHRFTDDPRRQLVLGGVLFEEEKALQGHSDADVVAHAVTDAVLGAAGLGDMGEHFPDTHPKWSGANSLAMLARAIELVRDAGFTVGNIDCTVVTERPKIAPYRDQMQENLSTVVNAPVNVKASRAEGLGALGRVEGAACWAVALLEVAK
jgi:2-C-methyl-D-erythritol 2,4-cyclodiphosphate synthase